MKLRNSFYILAALMTAFVSCEKTPTDTKEPEKAAAPVLVSTKPDNGATEITGESIDVVFTYDQNIKILTANQERITVSPKAEITKINPYNTTVTITLSKLEAGTQYTVSIPSGAVEGFKQNQDAAAEAKLTFTTKKAEAKPNPDVIPEKGSNDAWKMAEKLALGFNLGNHFDGFYNGTWAGDKFLYPDETVWGNDKCTEATFSAIYAAGFRSVRIPITWLKMIGDAPDYKIDEAWMSRIKEVVGWARDAGLNVIINTHHDEDHYLGSESLGHRWLNIMEATTNESINTEVKKKIKGVWTNIANEFKDEGDYLIFESFNEINDGKWGASANSSKQAQVLNQWNQVFVDAVRATGSKNETRWLGVPTYCASISFLKDFTMPEDPAKHTMLAVHSYDPYNFTLAEGLPQKKWGHTFNNNPSDEKYIREQMSTLYVNFVEKGIPVYLGEFGCSMREYNTSEWRNYKYYLEYFVKAAKSYGIPALLWDNGNVGAGSEHHAYINHGTGAYIDHSKEVIDVMVKAMTNESKDYTLQSVYDNAPKS